MRIALVNDYSLTRIGGAVTSMLEQKKALEQAGHTVFLIQLGERQPERTYDDSHFFYIKPHFYMTDSLYNMPMLFARKKHDRLIKNILVENDIDIVHVQTELTLGHLVTRVANILGIPVFHTIHTFFWAYGPTFINPYVAAISRFLFQIAVREKLIQLKPEGTPMERFLKSITLNVAVHADMVISPSGHQMKSLKKAGLKTPISVVPNPFIPQKNDATPLKTTRHKLRFVWIGRLDNEKRPLDFLEGVKQAHERTSLPFMVDIVGEGILSAKAKRRYSLPNVTFHGHTPHNKVVKLIDTSDMVVMSSYHFDNQPMVIAEAISRLRPVLFCDERLTEGVDIAGYLTKNETAEAFADALIDLIEHPEKVAALAKKTPIAARIFEPTTFAKTMTQLYKS